MNRELALLLITATLAAAQSAGTLFNGIELPAVWPPRDYAPGFDPPSPPPYILAPPAVIPIDVGRQLFVDYFLIEETSLRRTSHQAQYFPGSPVLRPDRPWEAGPQSRKSAIVFSDGVWYDPRDRLYKAWYVSGPATLYATSKDGIHWEKPALDVEAGTNIVHRAKRDSSAVWLDQEEKDPARRFKFLYSNGHLKPLSLYYSADGIHWGREVTRSPAAADRSTFFRNPFRNVWVISLRDHTAGIKTAGKKSPGELLRFRAYREHSDLTAALHWAEGEPVPWTGADRLDAARIDLATRPELYNLDAVAYESVMVGLFSVWRGQPDRELRDKPNEVVVGFSRDGFHWDRPTRRAFIPVSERPDAWNYSNVQSAGGVCLVVGDRLYFYVSGRSRPRDGSGENSTGLATLRRDGFVSMDAGSVEGTLTTRPVRFRGKHLFVNVASESGELRVEALDERGNVVAPFSAAACLPIRSDNTMQQVRWKGAKDLSALAVKPVRFRFRLRDGSLYAFWVSPDASGASHGYVAAGGPGFAGMVDNEGSGIYNKCCASEVLH